jgi:hypothetical protein
MRVHGSTVVVLIAICEIAAARQEALRWSTIRLTAIAIRVGNKPQERLRKTI